MRVSFSLLFAVILSLDAFAAPVSNANVGDDFALEVRKAAKVAAKKAPVKAKVPAIKAKPLPKKVAPKPAKPAVAPKPVAKKPAAVAKKPAAKAPIAKKPVVKPAAKTAAKPAVKPPVKPAAKAAAKPAAKPPVKPAAKKVTAPAKKPVTKAPVAKTPAKVTTPAAKTSAKPVAKGKTIPAKAPAAKVPTSCAVRPKPAVKPVVPRADFEVLDSRGKKRPRPQPISACGVVIRNDNVRTLCAKQKDAFHFANGALDKQQLRRRTLSDISDSEEEDSDDAEDEEDEESSSDSDDSQDGDFSPSPSPEPVAPNQCDHVLELQVLKRTLEAPGGVCATLKAMIASPNSGLTTADTADLMAPIKAAINGKSNLFFLDRKLNQVKRDEVTASLKGQKPNASSGDLKNQRVAVNKYLTDTSVNGPSLTLAKKLDSLVAAMLDKAETQALAHIKSCAVTTAAADEKALKAAKATLKTSPTVTSAWKKVLSDVAAQAKP